jgi:hypothetical protein
MKAVSVMNDHHRDSRRICWLWRSSVSRCSNQVVEQRGLVLQQSLTVAQDCLQARKEGATVTCRLDVFECSTPAMRAHTTPRTSWEGSRNLKFQRNLLWTPTSSFSVLRYRLYQDLTTTRISHDDPLHKPDGSMGKCICVYRSRSCTKI